MNLIASILLLVAIFGLIVLILIFWNNEKI
jgi:hypothetical protein